VTTLEQAGRGYTYSNGDHSKPFLTLTGQTKNIGPAASGCLARTGNFVVRLTTLSAWLMGYDIHYLKWWGRSTARSSRRSATQSFPK
jgi:hypothetical protein